MKSFITGLYLFMFFANGDRAFSQQDTSSIKALYDRALDFSSKKADSILYYANYIEKESQKLDFDKGSVLSLRLKGIYQEFREDYDSAINYYYLSLEQARLLNNLDYESAALGDLAIAYNNINQPEKTRDLFKEALDIAIQRKEIFSIFTGNTNLGSVYNRLGYPDSALIYLRRAQQMAKGQNFDLTSLYNNIGNAWFYKKEWDRALDFFKLNYYANISNGDQEMLWYDCLNMGDVFIEKKYFDSAHKYIDLSLGIAKTLGSRKKEADVYSLYAKYYSTRGDYKSAYQYSTMQYKLDTALVTERTLKTVAELQERLNVRQKDQENRVLALEIDRQKLRNRNIVLLTLGVASLAISTFVILLLIRRKNSQLLKQNELIQKQNHKLAQFNSEKNSLISVVSHDLNGPFTSIKMWTQILLSNVSNFTEDQKKALYRIQSSADNGELLIRDILYIEKEEIRHHTLDIEELEMNAFLDDIVQMYHPQAQQKDINITYADAGKQVLLINDRYIVRRIFENLLSNAIKFTPRGKKVWVTLFDDEHEVHIKVRDEGVGIAKEDIPYLFSKYRKISSMPTEGEYSTGIGLSIVKRLVEESNGKIVCESEPGKGSTFTVIFQK